MAELGRILIADDEEAFLQMTSAPFCREGYESACAPDATIAAQLLRSASY
jgi:DNA-binding response OmpR family regulator